MAKKRKKIQIDFPKFERQPYKSLNTIGKVITDTIVEISQGKRDTLGRRLKEKSTEAQKAIFDMVDVAFKELTPKQQRVLNLAFGLIGIEPHTEREIAKKMDISHQGVHTLKLRAINALRKKTELNLVALKKISEKP